jgi:cytochrome P450/NADPH-cytochrome P450 reductase
MVRTLAESQARARQLPIQTRLRVRAQRQFEEDEAFMNDLVDGIIAERRAEGAAGDTTDLLGRMLTGVDKDGEHLPDENIRAQCITFLIAGHETTSGLLSFAVYYLMKNPDVLARARAEVDEVFGATAAPTFDQVHRLRYVRQILDETLRLWPTAPGFNRTPFEDTVIGGKYAVAAGTPITVISQALHHSTEVWGPRRQGVQPRPHRRRADDRDPAQRLQAVRHRAAGLHRPPVRHPGGRAGARHAGAALRLRRPPRLPAEDEDHAHRQARRALHPGAAAAGLPARPHRTRCRAGSFAARGRARAARRPARHPARRAVTARTSARPRPSPHDSRREGTERGFAVTLGALDEHVEDLPHDGALLVVCSSYNGTPPDNAAAFCKEIPNAEGVVYSVFGCGSTEWASTYQAVPTRIDDGLTARGGRRIRARGEGNAAADFDAAYRNWHEGLWADVAGALGLPDEVAAAAPAGPRLAITLTNRQVTNPVIMSYRARPTRVLANRELIRSANGKPAERSTRHVEIALPAGTTYQAGDHLGVLPRNGIDLIRRVMARFGLDAGQYLTIIPNSGSHTHLPIDEPAPLLGVLASCVELQDVATATTSPRSPTTPTTRRSRPRCATSSRTTPSRCWRPTARCWTSWRRSRPATCRSRCTSTCSRRCGPATTRSRRRRWWAGTSAASPSGCCAGLPARARARSPASAPGTSPCCRPTARSSRSCGRPASRSGRPRTRTRR